MKKTKFLIFLLAMCFLGTVLIGCGGKADKPNDPNRTLITIGIKNDPTEKAIINAWKSEFESINKDIEIKLQTSIGANYTSSIFNFSVSEFPDLVWTAGDCHSIASGANKFLDLKSRFEEDFPNYKEDFSTVSMQSTKLNANDESIWFAPRDYNQLVVLFNRNTFTTAKKHDSTIKDPLDPSYYENGRTGWTWDEMIETCRKLRVLIKDINIKGEGLTTASFPIQGSLDYNVMYYTMLKGFGGDIFNANKEVVIDSEQAKEMYREQIAMYQEKLSTNNPAAFNKKLASMVIAVRPGILGTSKINRDVAPFPIMKNHVVGAGCSGYAISAQSSKEKQDMAWEFLKYMLSKQGQETFGATGAGLPVRTELHFAPDAAWRNYSKDINNDAFVNHQDKALYLNYSDIFPSTKHDAISTDVDDFFFSISNAKNQSESGLNTLIENYKIKIGRTIV